jgi:arylsulfatase A-like enzyme
VLDEYDRQMGRLFAGLKDLGIDGDTLVVFTSDNGASTDFRGLRNGGLRGQKVSLYEGGIRMPFVVRWPGRVPAGRVDSETVLTAVDLFPTFCALAGAALPGGVTFDGEDVSGALAGKPAVRSKPVFWEYGRNEKFFRYAPGTGRSPNVAVREGKWKLLVNADGTRPELYDLLADPKETENVAEKNAEMAARLKEKALAWRRALPGPP